MSTIWMNVTTSSKWNRAPVGIVRVERALAQELELLFAGRLKQCVWANGRFMELRPSARILDEQSQVSAPAASALAGEVAELPMMFPTVSRRQAVHALGQGLLSLTPACFRPFANRMLYRLRWRLAALIKRPVVQRVRASLFRTDVRQMWQESAGGVASEDRSADERAVGSIFSPGDVLISAGLDWDSDFYRNFYHLRRDFGVKVVSCCYDLIPVLFPQYCVGDVANVFASYFMEIADGSDLMLCISRQSEKDLVTLLDRTGAAKPLTHVFPLGDNVYLPADGEVVSDEIEKLCKEPYLLFVSTVERRKNHEVLYRAYHLLASEGRAAQLPKLVFIGMQGWGVGDLMKDIDLDPSVQGLIVRFNHVSDIELVRLYRDAMFCLYPSFYEGWGLPVGEALAMGKAVLCSSCGSLPEVGGDLVEYVDPWSPRDWADRIWSLISDAELRQKIESRVRSEYCVRTWQSAAVSVKNAIDGLLSFI